MKLIELIQEIETNPNSQADAQAIFLEAQPGLPPSDQASDEQLLEVIREARVNLYTEMNLHDRPSERFIGSVAYLKRQIAEFPDSPTADFSRFCQWIGW